MKIKKKNKLFNIVRSSKWKKNSVSKLKVSQLTEQLLAMQALSLTYPMCLL